MINILTEWTLFPEETNKVQMHYIAMCKVLQQ